MSEGLDSAAEQGAAAFWAVMDDPSGPQQEGSWRGCFATVADEEEGSE
jgi:hypothetical protein